MNPKKGDMVLYVDLYDFDGSYTPNTHPAHVVKVNGDGSCDLFVLFGTGHFHKTGVNQGQPDERGTWHPRE